MDRCLICDRIKLIKHGKNRFFVKELNSGYVVLGDHQYYNGYTLLLSKTHTDELHKLSRSKRTQFLEDMAITAEAVYKAFNPNKLNYELLGNTDSHLHWHIVPRYKNDPKQGTAIWAVSTKVRNAKHTIPDDMQLKNLKTKLLKQF